jgi:NADPH:quinone reductase-like Zn-dependent oxidoreductase
MKAIAFYKYGNPDELKLVELKMPEPKATEILVRLHATAVNSGDIRLRKADPFAVRFMLGLFTPKIHVLGSVFSGTVVRVGSQVKQFKVGDNIFGSSDLKFGTYAQYKCFSEHESIAIKPENVSHQEAAAIPFGACTALYFLRKVNIVKGQKILIYGATGAVGTAAIQLARYYGAHVTAVCSKNNADLAYSLGADKVVDYKSEDWINSSEQFDIVYDTVNKFELSKIKKILKSDGTMILGAADLKVMLLSSISSAFSSVKVKFGMIKHNQSVMEFIGTLIKDGHLRPVIDKMYELEQMSEAHQYVELGHKKGNVVINIGD